MHLCLHLENDHTVVTEDTLQQKIKSPPTATLSAFFDLCQKDEVAKLSLLWSTKVQHMRCLAVDI